MKSFQQFKHKAEVLKTIGFILATPFGINALNLLTGFHSTVNLALGWIISSALLLPAYVLVNRSLGLMEEIDGEINRLHLR